MGEYIKSDAVNHGRNYDQGSYKDNKNLRCSRCGWVLNSQRHAHGQNGSRVGWGISQAAVYSYNGGSIYNDPGTLYDDPSMQYHPRELSDPVVSGGCPQCGTLLY